MAIKESQWIWFDGRFVPWGEARVHVLAHALHYGSSVFEGIRAYATPTGAAIFRLDAHVARLFDSCRIARMPIPYTPQQIADAIAETVSRNDLRSYYIHPLVFRGYEVLGVDPRAWLEETAQRVFGSPQGIQEPEVWRENGTAAIVARAEEGRSLVFTPIPPQRFIKALNQRKRLGSAQVAVLGKKPRRAACTELSVLNSGPFFDLEAQQVWQKLAGEKLPIDRLWMFEVRN